MDSLLVCAAAVFTCALALPFAVTTCGAEPGPANVREQLSQFLQANCIDCHQGDQGEGGFDVDKLNVAALTELGDRQDLARWVRVYDRVNDEEMPPRDAGELDPAKRQPFLDAVFQAIDQSESLEHAKLGRVRSRRLTNDQLQWTLCDLLSIDIPLADLMPDEQRTDGFRNIAAAQSMSHYYLEDHLRVVDAALEEAFGRLNSPGSESVRVLPASQIADKRKGQRNRDPELRHGAAVIWSGGVSFYGRISNSVVQDAGWYKITLDASALKMPAGTGLWCSVRSGECVSRAPLMNWIGAFEATESTNTFTFTAWIEAGHMLEIRPADSTLKKARFPGGQVGFGEGEGQNVPGVAMHSLKIERIYPGGDLEDVRRSLLGDLNVQSDKQTNQLALDSETPIEDLKQQLRRFAWHAFRGPVSDEVLEPYTQLVDEQAQAGKDAVAILRQAYRALLCSPRFVYFNEAPGRLDDHAIANRLSYMLTGRAPDAELRSAADQGRLSDNNEIVAQVRRLLRDDHLSHFVRDFADQWLDLADIDFTEPDRRMHGDFDLVVQNAMLGETRHFLKTLIEENQPAGKLVDADFTWLNNRLARYYGIEADIESSGWKRVSLVDHPYRGGLMTHGSILKVTANGSNTSPVVRGVWICDRLLGVPIPEPPANVPAIEPDVRGATTVRQILEKHRSQIQCAFCHAKIDPPGFALEHFDAAGQWRDHYLTRKNKSYKTGPPVDSAYQLADGRRFDSFVDFRTLAASDDEAVARNFAAQLLIYATGKEITFADRKALDKIVAETKSNHYPIRSLIEAVATSHPFLNK